MSFVSSYIHVHTSAQEQWMRHSIIQCVQMHMQHSWGYVRSVEAPLSVQVIKTWKLYQSFRWCHVCRKTGEVNSPDPVLVQFCSSFVSPRQNPFTDNSELQQRTARMLNLNTWDVAVALTNFDWTIFDSIHEVCPMKTPNCRPEGTGLDVLCSAQLLSVCCSFYSKNSSTSPSAATVAAATLWR